MIIILRAYKTFWVVLFLSAFVQISISLLPSVGDGSIYAQWMRALSEDGLAAAYWDKPIADEQDPNAYYRIDYPPLYPYLLNAQGLLLKNLTHGYLPENDLLIRFWVKVPLIAANLFIAFLIYKIVVRKEDENTALLSVAAFAFNPAILFITCYWGQSDSLCALFLLLSVFLISENKPEFSWFFVTLAAFTKPIAFPFAAILFFATGWKFGWKRILPCFVFTMIASAILLAPFLWIGRLPDILRDLFFQIDAMPWVSSNAHNLWWIISGGLPWLDSNTMIAGPLSYKIVGIIIYAAFLMITLTRYRKSSNPDALYFVYATAAFGLFSLLTHMHAYHLFYALVFASILLGTIPGMRIFFVLLTITSFVNMILYDILFIYLSKTGMFLTMLNSQLCLGIFLLWLAKFYFEDSFDSAFEPKSQSRISLAKVFAVGLPIFLLTASPFMRKASSFQSEHFLLTEFHTAIKRTPSKDYIRKGIFMIHNDLRPVLFQHPPSELTYPLEITGNAVLRFSICLNPAVWNPQKGDGALFEISVRDQDGMKTVFSKYIDPKSIESDRKWHEETVDLSSYSGKQAQLVLSVQPGPAGDSRYDWAAWGDPRIISSGSDSFLKLR